MSHFRYLNAVLTVLCVLLGLNLYADWTERSVFDTPAYAQGIPDEGAQRLQMIDQLKLLNKKRTTTNNTPVAVMTRSWRAVTTKPGKLRQANRTPIIPAQTRATV